MQVAITRGSCASVRSAVTRPGTYNSIRAAPSPGCAHVHLRSIPIQPHLSVYVHACAWYCRDSVGVRGTFEARVVYSGLRCKDAGGKEGEGVVGWRRRREFPLPVLSAHSCNAAGTLKSLIKEDLSQYWTARARWTLLFMFHGLLS